MSKWLKMGCGHLVALPFLFLASLITFNIGQDILAGDLGNIDAADMGLSLVQLGVAGSVGGGLLFYLWRHVWPWEKISPAWMQRYATQAAGGLEAGETHPFTGAPVVPDNLSSPDRLEEGERPWEARDEWAQGRVRSERGNVWEGKSWFEQNSLAMMALAGTIAVGIGLFMLIQGGKGILAGIWFVPGIAFF